MEDQELDCLAIDKQVDVTVPNSQVVAHSEEVVAHCQVEYSEVVLVGSLVLVGEVLP